MSQHFNFLHAEWPAVPEAAARAEQAMLSDARMACLYTRRALVKLNQPLTALDLNPCGPEGLFNSAQTDALIETLPGVRERAAA